MVVMTQRPKLAMEAIFNDAIPVNVRYGTSFVFRQVHSPPLFATMTAPHGLHGCT